MPRKFISEYSLYKVKETPSKFRSIRLDYSVEIAKLARKIIGDEIDVVEYGILFLADHALRMKGYYILCKGSQSELTFSPQVVCKVCIDSLSEHCFMIHNHPSGDLTPSPKDIKAAKMIRKALELFGVVLLDSIIISKDAEYSLVENKRI